MITNIELNDSGAAKWNAFFKDNASESLCLEPTTSEMLNCMLEAAALGETFTYELGSQYTNTGRPMLFTLERADIELTEEADE